MLTIMHKNWNRLALLMGMESETAAVENSMDNVLSRNPTSGCVLKINESRVSTRYLHTHGMSPKAWK